MAHRLYLIVETPQDSGTSTFQAVIYDALINQKELTQALNKNFNTKEEIESLFKGTVKSIDPITHSNTRVDHYKTYNEALEGGMIIQYYIIRKNDGEGWVSYKGKGWLVENIKKVEGV
jgi:hypothetical protein